MLTFLVGPKGSGKTHVGRLLERRLGVHFLHVEPLWLAYHAGCRAEGREPDITEGIARVHPRIREAMAGGGAVCVETTGASDLILDALLSLERPCHTLTVRLDAPLDLCLERVAQRSQRDQIAVAPDTICQIHDLSRALALDTDLSLLNVDLDDETIVEQFVDVLDRKAQALAALRPPRDETAAARVSRLLGEQVTVVPYDPAWPEMFEDERERLGASLPSGMIGRIEHFGSTAVPGLAAKPSVDMLVEVPSRRIARERLVPILEEQGYDGLWRPTHGDDGPPFYPWMIRRDPATGARTHHIHMVAFDDESHWRRLRFRDHLRRHPGTAREYADLKARLAAATPGDRVAYTRGKHAFIEAVMREATSDHA